MNPGLKTLGRPLSRLLIATAVAAAFPVHADDKADIDKLKAQIQELDQKLRVLDRKQEIATEEATAKQKSASVLNASDKGFGFKSADGQFEYKLRGLVQLDFRDFGGTAFPTAIDGFTARRIRPTFEGTVFGKYGFRFTPEFGENKAAVVDAYLDVKLDPAYQIRLGKFKPFVGLERLQSGADIKFIERSYVSNNLLPNRDLGVSLFGDVLDKKLSYAVGVFNGSIDGGENTTTQDVNSAKEFTGRVFATPFIDTDGAWRGLGFGIAATNGKLNGTVGTGTTGLPNYKTPGQANNFFTYDSSVVASGNHTRWSPQAYYYNGPLGVIVEYAQVSQPLNRSGTLANVDNSAFQIAASWLLTGEDASFKGVKPYSPFRQGSEGGWGAVELLARYQENQIDSTLPSAFRGSSYALKAKSSAVGLNWYLNESSRVALNYEYTQLEGGTLDGKNEQFLVARYQLAF
jgi:phosphate-selective porin OprO/OprP